MDGYVTIGTKLDSKQLERDLKNEQRKLEKFEKETEKLTEKRVKIETEFIVKDKEFNRKIKEIEDKAKIDIQAISGGSFYSRKAKEQKINETAQLKINQLTEQYNEYVKQVNNEIGSIDEKLQENAYKQGLVNNNIEEMSSKLKQVRGFDNIKGSIDGIGSSLKKVTKRVVFWGLAFLGVRSAISLVRRSMSTLSQYDDQIATDIEYMRYAIANTLKPIIEWILNLVKQIFYYVGYIAKAWFGVDLYAKSSAKDFANANKQAKKLDKTMAGFDEMNVLSNGDDGSSSGTPSFDLAEPKDVKTPSWLKWLGDNGEEVAEILLAIATGLTAIKLGLEPLKALGLGIALDGILRTIRGIRDFLKDKTFKNFIKILEGIAETVLGIGILFASWPVAIAGALALVVIEVVKHFDEIMGLFNKFIGWIDKDFRKIMRDLFGPIGDIITNVFLNAINYAKTLFEGFYGGIKKIVDGIVRIFRGDFLGGINDVFGGLFSIVTAPFNGMINFIKGLWNMIKEPIDKLVKNINKALDKVNPLNILGDIGKGIGKGIGSIGKLFGFAKGGVVVPKLATGGIINNPGSGVPIASAIGGERGAEGVIPLTDSQQMSLLGEAIGRYITVNLTNVTQLDGRQIARKVDKIAQNNNFVFNR